MSSLYFLTNISSLFEVYRISFSLKVEMLPTWQKTLINQPIIFYLFHFKKYPFCFDKHNYKWEVNKTSPLPLQQKNRPFERNSGAGPLDQNLMIKTEFQRNCYWKIVTPWSIGKQWLSATIHSYYNISL